MWTSQIPAQRSGEEVPARPVARAPEVIDVDAVVAGVLPLTGCPTAAVQCGVLTADLRR